MMNDSAPPPPPPPPPPRNRKNIYMELLCSIAVVGWRERSRSQCWESTGMRMRLQWILNSSRLLNLKTFLLAVLIFCVLMSTLLYLLATIPSTTMLRPHDQYPPPPMIYPPPRVYENNGYLIVSSNGGLNQMRAGICDMVTVARYMNVTLVVPQLDKTSLWNDQSSFEDIFNVDYFINSLRDEVQIIKENELPPHLKEKLDSGNYFSMPPISWSNMSYYTNIVLPRVRENGILHLTKTDARLANNGQPLDVQKLRCRVNYDSMRFTPQIEQLGKKIVHILGKNGPFLVLHLRYEKDIISFTGCNEGCNDKEIEEVTKMRYNITWWKRKEIDSTRERLGGFCPMTPEETALVLRALGIPSRTPIYIAAGKIYGGERRLASLKKAFPNVVTKEDLLPPSDLLPFRNHSSRMAALDYIVSTEADVFFPTYGGNMAKVVEGHRRILGFRTTIQPDKKTLVKLIDRHRAGRMSWENFSSAVKKAQENRIGSATNRVVIPKKPKEEDYFWANPQECLPAMD